VKLFVIKAGRRFYRTHYGGDAIVLPLWGRVKIEPSRMKTLQGSMNSDVLWGACKPLQCNSTCNNFITNLPAKREENPRFLMVITNKLLKSCTLKAITFIKAEDCAKIFVQCHYRFHKFFKFITLNKRSNWVKKI
jgi:hypothetical protein